MLSFRRFLFGWLLLCLLASATSMPLTTVTDTVYRADGAPAQGTVMISWPAFTTSDNRTVAAGSKSVAIGANGTLTVALAPNYGGTPAGTYYKIVYKLSECLNASVWYKGQPAAQ